MIRKMDKEISKSIIVLTAVCVFATLLLSIVYVVSEPYIEKQNEVMANQKYLEIFTTADDFKEVEEGNILVLQKGLTLGIIKEINVQGYGGNIKMLVGIYENNSIAGVRILEHTETPGLGANIVLPKFLNQFIGREKGQDFRKGIDGITGATISTEAVIKGIMESYIKQKEQ
jgi:Na+-translocating ferredoxin:NAD+ oxidoreductase subunit G